MTVNAQVDPELERTALLIMDVQPEIVGRFGDRELVHRLATAADAARAAGVLVIYVKVGFRSGHPEINLRNRSFAAVAAGGGFVEGVSSRLDPELLPAAEDLYVTKRRVSAFAGSDLELVLRARGIESLVLAGIATSGVVLSTLRQAADLDFGLTVLSDGCVDSEPEVHQILLEKVFPRQAEVITTAAWRARLAVGRAQPA